MGSGDIELLIRLHRKGAIGGPGAVMEIGAQQLSNSFLRDREKLAELGTLFGISTPFEAGSPKDSPIRHGGYEMMPEDAPRSRAFWEWLGWRYASIDIDGDPDATPIDLNYDEVPLAARGRFNLIVNAGTTEHVANQVNAFKVVHDLAAVGAIMVHNLPAQGMMQHGLVNYNPKFFWMLGRSNGYRALHFDLVTDHLTYGVPEDILEHVAEHGLGRDVERNRSLLLADCSLVVAFQKIFDTEYVAPLDIPDGAKAADANLKRRYWSLFESGAWDKIEREHESALAARRAAEDHAAKLAEEARDAEVAKAQPVAAKLASRASELRKGALLMLRAVSPRLGIWRTVRSIIRR